MYFCSTCCRLLGLAFVDGRPRHKIALRSARGAHHHSARGSSPPSCVLPICKSVRQRTECRRQTPRRCGYCDVAGPDGHVPSRRQRSMGGSSQSALREERSEADENRPRVGCCRARRGRRGRTGLRGGLRRGSQGSDLRFARRQSVQCGNFMRQRDVLHHPGGGRRRPGRGDCRGVQGDLHRGRRGVRTPAPQRSRRHHPGERDHERSVRSAGADRPGCRPLPGWSDGALLTRQR